MTKIILCKFPLFSTDKPKLGHSIFEFILRFEIGIFECDFGLYLKLFANSQKYWDLLMLPLLDFSIFFQFMKEMEYLNF